ncbi:MAG: HlyD family efflux transporter periplasmic adaptor subunit [Bacteroidia bacterium]|nr:HlyD family efflux transporter periplasmic adaptor subunit [Bacteroidia bacterium]NNF30828.1 HlyD family efflux transporter periplasmic adaptor subunit [Flavobacteriaceae bacterium]MBT8275465.1 HlyD family efflux transporter periplasmic adaptor subunit [Bacteroidia bacterium]NNJ82001.1 HlyD family efflux transporter periplasmic adaptor subunit [Flavobacteriaceae bacterium]NNK54441.1 HlyD family efflux transporter periplasmic adaptor subunit [Flavobacteriaceae bacterium]
MRSFLVFLMFISLVCCDSKEDRIQPKRTDLTESVYASATVQPDSLYKVYAAVSGILDDILVEEGDTVVIGEPVVKIINTNPALSSENAKLAYELAKSNYSGNSAILKTLEEEIAAARLKLSNDSVNYCRQKNLWDQQIGSKAEYDTRKLAYDLSKNTVARLENNYSRTKEELETQFQQAGNQYKSALVTTGDFTVKSKINGTVYSLLKNPGELVSTLEPIATIGSTNDFIIELLIDEVDVVKVRKAQKVIVSLDSYGNRVFTAIISRILPAKDMRNQTFTVEAIFEEEPGILYPGLSGEANIIIAVKEDVLTIPKLYLIDENKVKTEDGIVEIETGLQDLEKVEILSGISEDDWILKPAQ